MAETGHKSSSVILRNEWPRGMVARSPPSRRVCTTTTTTNLHHSVGPMDRKMPPSSSSSPEYPHGLAYARKFRVKARRRRCGKARKTRKSRQTSIVKATTALGDDEDRIADLKFQNFPDNVPCVGVYLSRYACARAPTRCKRIADRRRSSAFPAFTGERKARDRRYSSRIRTSVTTFE